MTRDGWEDSTVYNGLQILVCSLYLLGTLSTNGN